MHNAYGYGLFTGGLGLHYGAERLGCTVVPVSSGQIEVQILKVDGLTQHYLCVLARPGRLDTLTVQVEALERFAAGEAAGRLGGELVERVKQLVGVTIDVEVVAPGALERSQGKARRIDDRR